MSVVDFLAAARLTSDARVIRDVYEGSGALNQMRKQKRLVSYTRAHETSRLRILIALWNHTRARARAIRTGPHTNSSFSKYFAWNRRAHSRSTGKRERSTCDRTNELRSYPDDGYGRTDSEVTRARAGRHDESAGVNDDEARPIARRERKRENAREGGTRR